MPIVRHFIRHCSVQGLQEYFNHKNIAVSGVDWSQDHTTVTNSVIQLVDHLPAETQVRLRMDAERIHQMSDEIGQAALLAAAAHPVQLSRLVSGLERSRWLYLNEPEQFQHAEDIRYADHYRYGRNWSGYKIDVALPLHTDPISIASFKNKIKSVLDLGNKVKVELFDRTMPDDNGDDIDVVQVMVYQEGLPDSYLEFESDDHIVSRIRRPVSEHAIIYAPDSGCIEVVASQAERRNRITKAFIEDLLKQPVTVDKMPLRRYDLQPLMRAQPLDWDIEDGIESVQLVMMKFKDLANDGRVQIDVPAKSSLDFHTYAQTYFIEQNPLASGAFMPTQAGITLRFYPENGKGRGKVLPVKINLPNGCDLRSRTERERLIGEKYLKRWGLLEDI